jgi:hypothetical protein
MRLLIKNVLGITEGDIGLDKITFLAGRNGAGKTSVVQAAWAVALAEPRMRGISRKADFIAAVHDGAAQGSVTWDRKDGWTRLTYPDGGVETSGPPATAGTALGLGAALLSGMKPAERAQEIGARFGGQPTEDDLAAFLAVEGGLDQPQAAAMAKATWEKRIAISGWDACHATAMEHAAALKGRWSQAAGGQTWGEKKAPGWRPAILHPDRNYDLAEVSSRVKAARQELEDRIGAAAVSDADITRMQQTAGMQIALDTQAAPLRVKVSGAEKALVEARAAADAAPAISDTERPLACPHCNALFKLTRAASGALVPSAVAPAMSIQAIKDANRRHQTAVDAVRQAQRDLDALTAELQPLEANLRQARDAAAKLVNMRVDDAETRNARARAREKLQGAEAQAEAVQQMQEAGKVYAEYQALRLMLDALAPGGVRSRAAQRAIIAFNEALATLSAAAGVTAVQMHEDYSLSLGGRPYLWCSESEQWRIDAMTTLAVAQQERPSFTALDRLDLIVADQRGGILKAALSIGVPTLIACTVQEPTPERLPPLKQRGVGRVCWLGDSRVTETAL